MHTLIQGAKCFLVFSVPLGFIFLEGGFALLFLDKVCARLELALLA